MNTTALLLGLTALLAPQERIAAPHLGVRTTTLSVRVAVVDDVATTTLRQTIRNDTARQAEATWVLPLPVGAVADDFKMTVGGVEVSGEVLGADQAREVYESIVRRRRDPGLLEYLGRGCLRARIFPVPAQGEVGVEVSFRHVLPRLAGLSHWSFPARAVGVGGHAPESITLDLSIRSRRSIKNAYSPLAGIEVLQTSDHDVRASFEGKGGTLPEGELAVLYGLSEKDFGLDLLSHRAEGDGEGTFLMLISPKRDWPDRQIARREITFVLDTSGSMAGDKIDQAKGALRFFLSSLRPEDRFNVVPFATEPRPFFPEPVQATEENVKAALLRAERDVRAVGGTNIDEALARGFPRSKDDAYVPIVVLLTDGVPTVGTVDADQIIAASRRRNVADARVFVLGVGDDVNTQLLDLLAEETRGTRSYVRPGEDLELVTSALFTKLSHPVLTDLRLSVDGVRVSRIVPGELPDLFEGERLEIHGRYTGEGTRAIRLSGRLQGKEQVYVFEGTFAKAPVDELTFLPSLWAHRRVGVLLDAIRLNGPNPELLDEVRRLGKEYRIVTPYTSHLIVEEGMQVASNAPGPWRGAGDTNAPASPGARRDRSAAETGSDAFFLGRGKKSEPDSEAQLVRVAKRLREVGVLADDADAEEARELAQRVVDSYAKARDQLAGLASGETVGKEAVDRSESLRRLMQGGRLAEGDVALLFTRRVRDKTFTLRGGVWTDRTYDSRTSGPKTTVEAFSPAYFELLRRRPALGPYLALGQRLLVVLDGEVVEIVAPRER
jgi:Ca-activated chloride channel family protein